MTRVRPSGISLFVLAVLALIATVIPAFAQSGVAYIYDQLGRLVGVIDPSGNTAAYSYDAVGNLLAITRYSSTQISLINFSPTQGPVGTTVTISGSGFSTTISQDTVTFNGTTATVTSASINSLVVTVPTGASTGQIQVTSPAGTATSSANFTFTADSGAPTISSISPTVATHGTSITVSGANINPTAGLDAVSFNITQQPVSSASSTSLAATVPVPTSSGRITLSTPGGTAVSSQDLYIPFGTHVASDVDYAERTTVGTVATVSIPTAGHIGLLIFDGTAGQKVNLLTTAQSLSSCEIYLFAPNGSQIFHNIDSICGNSPYGAFPVKLPATGTYTVGIDSDGETGSITLTVQDTSDVTGTLTAGGSAVTVTTTVPGQDARLTFTGTIGQQVYLKISNVTTNDAFVYLVRPDGTYQGQSLGIWGTDQTNASVEIGPTSGSQYYYLDTTILEMAGTYTVWVQHVDSFDGSEQLYLGNAPSPVTGTIGVDGSPVTVTTTTAWQSAELTFSGTAGQTVFLKITDVSTANGYVNLIAPDGTVLWWIGFETGSGAWFGLNPSPLPMSGTYTWWVQNDGADTGSETLELYSFPASSGTISPGGSAVTVTTTTPGQQEMLTFSGTEGQRVFLTITDISTQDAFVYLIRNTNPNSPVNEFLGWTEINSGAGYWYYISPDPLPYTGTYEIFVQHVGSYTGSETLQLYDVTSNVTGTITAGGSSVTATTTIPGQDATITFSGTTGERIYLLLSGVTLEDAYVSLIAPDGTNLGWIWTGSSYSSNYQFGPGTLPQTGTYTWLINNYSPTTGSETLQMYDPPADVTGTITDGGSAVTVTTTAVGQGAELTFSGTASESVTLTVTSVSNGGTWINLMDPYGNYVDSVWVYGSGSSTFTMGPDTLPSTGTYTLWIQAVGMNYGSETLQLN